MTRLHLILLVALMVLAGSGITVGATMRERDEALRGYVDPTRDSALPFRVPRLGVNAELTQYDADELTAQLQRMDAAHITWVRQFARWDTLEARSGEFDWSAWDRLVDAFEVHDSLELVAVLVNSPQWAREQGTQTAPPDDPAAFAAFAAAFASRYGETIDFYQIWDEPNLTNAWGGLQPQAADYAALLRAAYAAIHHADAEATVIAGALAPTTEGGPHNYSDLDYLRALYAYGAREAMDAIAAKPYGFDASPLDRRVRNEVLNFSRLVALREIMVANGDSTKALWASEWGWNALPDDWTGAPSIWGQVSEETRRVYTLDALDRAEREWPWLGGMILTHWQPDAPIEDPRWGFTLVTPSGQPTPLLDALRARPQPTAAVSGLYRAANPFARYSGVWTFGDLGADIGWIQDSRFTFDFSGTDVALLLRQDDFQAFLYPTINDQPANALPRDVAGNAYLSLTSDTLEPAYSVVPIARGLPFAQHTLQVTADRGWDRWVLAGFAVSSGDLAAPYNQQIAIGLLTVVVAAFSAAFAALQIDWHPLTAPLAQIWHRLGRVGQLVISAVTSIALLIGMLLTWGDAVPSLFRREPVQIGLALLTAGLLYISPSLLLTLLAGAVLFVIVYHRPDLGLMLAVFYAPFFLFPVELYRFAFPLAELVLLLTGAAWALRGLASWGRARRSGTAITIRLQPLDWGVLAWVILGVISVAWAQYPRPALTELRTLILEPALFYIILRTTIRDRTAWLRLVDVLLGAGALVALIGLVLFVRGESIITAEGGAERLSAVYGSPNNVALLLGRCIPFALAFLLAPLDMRRRITAAALLLPILPALLLTQSAGALFIGVPASIVTVLLLMRGRRALPILGLLLVGGLALAAVALQSARFARILDFSEGTNFFRLRVWQSAINVLRDHPITGLGLDQFLYAFQGRYMLPDAWQEPSLSHPHNFLLDFWVRLGVFGVALFAWLQAAFWRGTSALVRRFRADALAHAVMVGAVGSMVNLLGHGLVDNSVFVNDLALIFMLLLGLVAQGSNIVSIDGGDEIMV